MSAGNPKKNRDLLYAGALLALILLSSCGVPGPGQPSGQNADAADDLLNAFQSGCSVNGTYLNTAIQQTSSVSATLKDLEAKNSCSGLSASVNALNLLGGQISEINNNSYASSISQLSNQQQMLMLQMEQATDPNVIAALASTYSSNLVEMASAQGVLVTANGSLATTPLQEGSLQLSSYLNQIFADQSSLYNCGANNPAMAAQMGAGLLAVAGSFTGAVTGSALSLAGQVLGDAVSFIHNASYENVISKLDQTKMAVALPCGFEEMMDVYCQASDLKQITSFEACNYNPKLPQCAAGKKPKNPKLGDTSEFWQGLDVLVRELPAMQIWINQVATGVIPSDPAEAQRIDQASDDVNTLREVQTNADGVMNDEVEKIAKAGSSDAQELELRNGLGLLVSVLAYNQASFACISNSFSGISCQATPISKDIGSSIQILYNLVNRNPALDSCVPSSPLASGCLSYQKIPLDGLSGSSFTGKWMSIEANAGGLPNLGVAGLDLIDTTLNRYESILNDVLNTDPSSVLESAAIPAGAGLPAPITAITKIIDFVQHSHDYLNDPKQVPDKLLGEAASLRGGIVGLLADTKSIVSSVKTALATMDGNSNDDLKTLAAINVALHLAKDRDFLSNRLQDQIKFDIKTRIAGGQIPENIFEILSQAQVDPTVGLTQISASDMDKTLGSLNSAQTTSQLNLDGMTSFFNHSLQGILLTLKGQADKDGEPLHANPITSPNRMNQARVCLQIVSSQDKWPSGVDVNLCKGVSFSSAVTGETLSFDTYYAQMVNHSTLVPQRMCTFYRFYRTSENFTHDHANQRDMSLDFVKKYFPSSSQSKVGG